MTKESALVELLDGKLDWQHWYRRWEAMQNCYVPHRLHRFDLMLRLAELPGDRKARILDLGCGPGSLAFRALQHYPCSRILAVDSDLILLTMGRRIAQASADRIQFLEADIRQADWWMPLEKSFDLIISATALHWLKAEHLAQAYRQIYRALKPGGWFVNSDHIASDYPDLQARYRQMLGEQQDAAFQATGADDWDGFWQNLTQAVGQAELSALYHGDELWEGTDDGQPKAFHIAALQECGFQQVTFHWQELGEAVIGARRPVA